MAENEPSALVGHAPDIQSKIVSYVSEHGQDTSFADFFWKKCEPHPYELRRYPLYVSALLLFKSGKSVAEIARRTHINQQSVRKWTRFEQKSKLAHFLSLYLQLGIPRPGWVWLSVNNTSGHAIPLGPVVDVPMSISNWDDIAVVLAQIKPIEPIENGLSREYLFGFLTGMIIGDSAKSRAKNWHRHIGLVLSKKYATNEKIGEFTCACARNIGSRMHRVADQPKRDSKPHGFYEWVSQASPLIDWIFNTCLGLRDGQCTTYDPVSMDWALSAPEEFRRGLVQGIAESDGSVSIASQAVEFWIGPNWEFCKKLLMTFGVKSFKNREALSATKTQVHVLGRIPAFSPHLRTARYLRFQKLVSARHVGHGKRLPPEIRQYITHHWKEASIPKLSEMVLDKFGLVLSFEAVQRWVGKAQRAEPRGLEGRTELNSDQEAQNQR